MHIWFVLLMIYCLIASVLPVWLLLQPRDYLSIYVLLVGMVLGYLGLFLMHAPMNTPAIVSFSSNIGPMWPMLCVIIACGAISGFHSLVAGGTTSKQLDRESDGKFIGYGGMITESILAILALLAVTAGLYYVAPSGMEEFSYGTLMQEKGWIVTFGVGYGRFLSFIKIPMLIGSLIGVLMLITFILTTLDTSTRLSRFILTESIGDRISIFKNRWFATVISLLPAFYLGFSGHWEDIWPVFGASNQLVAALALLIVSTWLAEIKKPSRYTLIPCIFMLFTTIGALIVELYQFLFFPGGKYLLGAIALVLMIMAMAVVKEALGTIRRMRTIG
jgi:carbon starvation protein